MIQRYNRQINEHSPRDITWNFFIDFFTPQGRLIQAGTSSPTFFLFTKDGFLYGIDTSPLEQGELNPSIVVYKVGRQFGSRTALN